MSSELARELAWRIKGFPNHCAVCSFPLAASADSGCVIGNCSYRPRDGSAEDGRVSRHRAELAEVQGVIQAILDVELARYAAQVRLEEAKWWAAPLGELDVKLCEPEKNCVECGIKRERPADLARAAEPGESG